MITENEHKLLTPILNSRSHEAAGNCNELNLNHQNFSKHNLIVIIYTMILLYFISVFHHITLIAVLIARDEYLKTSLKKSQISLNTII